MFLQLLFVPHIPQEPFSCSKGLPGINYPAGTRAGQAFATPRMFLHFFHPFPSFPASRRVGRATLGALGPLEAQQPGKEFTSHKQQPKKFPPQLPTPNSHLLPEDWKCSNLELPPEFLQKSEPSSPAQLCTETSAAQGG